MAEMSATPEASPFLAMSVNHPRLVRTDAESIRVFLRLYDQYSKEVTARVEQLTVSPATTEAVRPVNLKYCVDPEYLESAIDLGLIEDVENDDLTDIHLRKYLEGKAEESRETVSLEVLDEIVNRELRMNIRDKNARSRMESLFVTYHALLRRNGLS